jgi:hypothetical protein
MYGQRINTVPKLYSRDLGTFRVALLFCYPQRLEPCDSDSVRVLGLVTVVK